MIITILNMNLNMSLVGQSDEISACRVEEAGSTPAQGAKVLEPRSNHK